ncbi:hypothetical protein IFR04_007809 [Cadophora malorum]|uniref:Thioredoxin domain-containing protein n=1 Tax=Cadophora malorum TaxID=108018 RepID=A0A8H7THR2_9HELO|nr:hypothetical protein IFR04_007809 [Cadophora malorum]
MREDGLFEVDSWIRTASLDDRSSSRNCDGRSVCYNTLFRPLQSPAPALLMILLDLESSFTSLKPAFKADFAAALKDNKIVVLDCFATWCGPCKVIAPQVVKFSDEFPNAHFAKLDVDEVPDVAQELGIRAMPTFLIFKDGEKVKEVVGANPNALKSAIEASVV